MDTFASLIIIGPQKTWPGMFAQHSHPWGDLEWLNANICEGQGSIGRVVYPRSGFNPDIPGMQEGHTPVLPSSGQGGAGAERPGAARPRSDGTVNTCNAMRRRLTGLMGPGALSIHEWLLDIQGDFARLGRLDAAQPKLSIIAHGVLGLYGVRV